MSQPSSSTTATTAATNASPEAFLCTVPLPFLLAPLLSPCDLLYRLSGQSRSLYEAYGKETTHGLRFADNTLSLIYPYGRRYLDYNKKHPWNATASLVRLLRRYPTTLSTIKFCTQEAIPFYQGLDGV